MKKAFTEVSKAWEQRRSRFSHDWLTSRFDRDLYAWLAVFRGELEDEVFSRKRFREGVLEVWSEQHREACQLVDDYEHAMTPAALLDELPLVRMPESSRKWLGELVHILWKLRCGVDRQELEVRTALKAADGIFQRIQAAYDDSGFEALIGHDEFITLLQDSIQRCKALGDAIHRLNREILVV